MEHFWALSNFSVIFSTSLHLAYYFFNILLFFHNSNSKIFQPCFTLHIISQLQSDVLFSSALGVEVDVKKKREKESLECWRMHI